MVRTVLNHVPPESMVLTVHKLAIVPTVLRSVEVTMASASALLVGLDRDVLKVSVKNF